MIARKERVDFEMEPTRILGMQFVSLQTRARICSDRPTPPTASYRMCGKAMCG